MDDKKFDEMIKNQVQKDEKMDKRFEELFETYKEKYKMERGSNMKTNNVSFIQKMRYVAAVLVVGILLGTGGMTYAHISGVETWISPLLRKIGIDSKYEENSTKVNDEVTVNNEKVEMLDVAIDNSTLIVGYKITMPNVELENWIEVHGDYTVNDINIRPVNIGLEKDEGELGTEFVYYQIFDLNEIDFEEEKELKFKSEIFEINEYVEVEDLVSARTKYLEKYEGKWSFEKDIEIKNVEENVIYELVSEEVKYKDIIFDATEVVKSSYTNMIKIKTDKSNHQGDAFEVYYRIFNESGEEIAAGNETRDYDERIYNDRLFIKNLNENSKLRIDIYFNDIKVGVYEKIGEIKVDMSKAKEKEEEKIEYTKYIGDDYRFEYNKEWTIIEEDVFGPLSRYKGSLLLNAPTTTNEEYGMMISIIKVENDNLEKHIDDLRAGYEKEYCVFESKEKCTVGSFDGFKLVMSSAESIYISYAVEVDGFVFELNFAGDEKEINNRKAEIEKLVESFEIKENMI